MNHRVLSAAYAAERSWLLSMGVCFYDPSGQKEGEIMITPETKAEIKRLYHSEHFMCQAIAEHLDIHHLTVRNVVRRDSMVVSAAAPVAKLLDPFVPFMKERLEQYPRIRSPRLMQMLVDRGFKGSINTVRRGLRELRSTSKRRAFLPISSFVGDEAQVDWAHSGTIKIGNAEGTQMF